MTNLNTLSFPAVWSKFIWKLELWVLNELDWAILTHSVSSAEEFKTKEDAEKDFIDKHPHLKP